MEDDTGQGYVLLAHMKLDFSSLAFGFYSSHPKLILLVRIFIFRKLGFNIIIQGMQVLFHHIQI